MGLAACAQPQLPAQTADVVDRTLNDAEWSVWRSYENIVEERPFALGVMSIVATERGKLRTFRLAPCHNGIVCAGSERGRHGRVEMTEDYVIVRGLYGRTFYLSNGGDGYLERHGHAVMLAWDSDVVRFGPEAH